MTPVETMDPIEWAVRGLKAVGIDSPRLEAQLLLALALGTTRTAVVAGLYRPLEDVDCKRFEDLVEARCARTPLAYLRGSQEFYGLDFEVSPAVLIPRPETEMLVDFALEWYLDSSDHSDRSGQSVPHNLADVGTGSGCVAIAALTRCPRWRCAAFDLSRAALQVARRNAVRHAAADRLRFVQSDLLTGAHAGRFGLILSNPPYVATDELERLQPEVRNCEPRIALDGGADGLNAYRRLTPMAQRSLVPGGCVAVEVGMGQASEVANIFACAGFRKIEIRKDLAGIERLVSGRKNDSHAQRQRASNS